MNKDINFIQLVKEKGTEESAKEMKNNGCVIKYGFKAPLNACYYTEDCGYCWKEVLEDIDFRYHLRNRRLD